MPEAVSRALLASLEWLAGEPPTRAAVDALCVADRQFLMRALEAHLGHGSGWFEASCTQCAARFDFRIDLADLPHKPAGSGFPQAAVTLGRRRLRLRVPSGADQIRVLGEDPAARREALLRALEIPAADGCRRLPAQLREADFARCEGALEAVAPQLALEVAAACPECGHSNRVGLDPYGVLGHGAAGLLADVHRLAWHYHWSEGEILALPRGRRAHYLRLVDAARGMSQ